MTLVKSLPCRYEFPAPLQLGILVTALVLQTFSQSTIVAQMAEREAEGELVGYDRVREVLRKRCVTCHNLDELRGELNLADLPAILAGSSSGPVVVAGKPNQSSLYKSAAHLEDPAMPPNSPRIPPRELDLLSRWIEGGLAEKSGSAESQIRIELPTVESLKGQDLAQQKQPFANINGLLRATAIAALDVHPTQNLAAVSGDRQAVLFDPITGEFVGALDFPEGEVTALRFSRDGNVLVVAGGVAGLSGRVVGFDLETGKRAFELADENDTILTVDLSADGKQIAVGGPAKVVRIMDVASGLAIHTLRKHTDWVLTARFSPDGLLLASGDRFGGLYVWEAKSGEEFYNLRGHTGSVNAVAWKPNGEELISAGNDGAIRIWNMHQGTLANHWDAGVGAILSLTHWGDVIASGGRTNRVSVWKDSGDRLFEFETTDQVERIGISPEGRAIVAVDAAGVIHGLASDSATSDQFALRFTTQLPIDESRFQAVLTKLDLAEFEYAKRVEAAFEQPSTAESAKTSSLATIETEVRATEQRLAVMRAQATETQRNAQTIAESIFSAESSIQKLHEAQDSLALQAEVQSGMVNEAARQLAALYALKTALSGSLAEVDNESAKRFLLVRLEHHQRLLQAASVLQSEFDQVENDATDGFEFGRSRDLLVQLSSELESKALATKLQLEALEVNESHTKPPIANSLGATAESE